MSIEHVRVVVTQHVVCPSCGHDAAVWGHLPPGRSWGPWYCSACGVGISGTVAADGSPMDVTLADTRCVKTWVLLRRGGLFIVVSGMRFEGRGHEPDPDDPWGGTRYYYDEHTCPVNYLGVEAVLEQVEGHGLEDDPHGCFQFAGAIDQVDINGDPEWTDLFPQIANLTTVT